MDLFLKPKENAQFDNETQSILPSEGEVKFFELNLIGENRRKQKQRLRLLFRRY